MDFYIRLILQKVFHFLEEKKKKQFHFGHWLMRMGMKFLICCKL